MIGLILITAFFLEENYTVIRQVNIEKSQKIIFKYLKYLKNQEEFSVWAQIDPNMKKNHRGVDGEVGYVSAWDSDNESVGKGEQEIIKITPESRIDYELQFYDPFEVTHDAYLILEKIENNKTNVKWGFDGKMSYPMNIMSLFMNMDDMLGPDLQTGLNNLKEVLEKDYNE
jgi:hypothetical protein